MTITIGILAVSLVLVIIVLGIYLIYSVISSKNTMQNTMKTKALDVFVYLGIAIALITTVTNLLQILFTAINRKFPDTVLYYYVDTYSSDVRFSIASLIVMFPIYLALSWYVANDIKKFLYKQDIAVRKIMIYVTLFVTILSLIGTLVYVIYTYLGGELSARFLLKALTVLITSAVVFWYYYYSLKRDYSKGTKIPLIAGVLASLAVVASLVWSISIIGTPSEMRAKRFDSTRLSDISRIQSEILNRIQVTDKLPLTLAELDNAFQGYTAPSDPVTKESYGYHVVQQPVIKMNYTTNRKEMTTPAIFELCANFETTRELDARGNPAVTVPKGGVAMSENIYSAANYYNEGDTSPFWNHDIGETCFKRVISPDMYYGRY